MGLQSVIQEGWIDEEDHDSDRPAGPPGNPGRIQVLLNAGIAANEPPRLHGSNSGFHPIPKQLSEG